MAITINQQPTYPNVTYTNLLYAVSSNHVTSSQFQYVMDVVSGSQVLTRIRQYPNPVGSAIFDPSRIMNDYLEYTTDSTSLIPASGLDQVKDFQIKFGEEYATSPSSSVLLYNGNDVTGSPAVTGTTAVVFPGIVDPNNGVSYNWQGYDSPQILTDRPNGIGKERGDDMSITVYNPTPETTLYAYVIYPGLNVQEYAIDSYFTQVPILGSSDSSYTSLTFEYASGLDSITIPITDGCNWERVNFAFINNYGFWDFYGVNLPQKKTTNLKRQSLTKPFVDYSSATSAYDVTRRGKEYYNISYEDNYEVVTDWLGETEAEWLSQMIESPEVYVQQGSNMIPIVITNSNYDHNTNRRGQKLFQYTIQYQLANSRRGR